MANYDLNHSAAFAGMKVDMMNDDARSFVSGESSDEIPFGVMIAQGTADDQGELPDGSGDELVGVLLHSHAYARTTELGTTGLKPKASMSVLNKGRVWVICENGCVPGDEVHVRYATGAGGTQLGAFRSATVSSETIDVSEKCRWLTTATSGNLAVLEIDMSNRN